MASILVIDDEPQIRRFLRISLGANGYQVMEAETAAAGLEAARGANVDLVILDLGLPDMDGQDLISALRQFLSAPIIVLSVRAEEQDKVEALDRGADDYMVKPFGTGELMARVRAALRQPAEESAPTVLQVGSIHMDFARRIVTRDGVEMRLSRREYDLLFYLASHLDHVLTHRQILKAVWGPAHVEDVAYLRVYVSQLREKLEADPAAPKIIVTEPGIGYRLRPGKG